jgi:hypothetical protein
MKKNIFILWIGAFVITFLTLYISNLLSNEYPITGTVGIDGKKVSYRFEKIHFTNTNLEIIIRSDVDSLNGNIFWKETSRSKEWNVIRLIDSTKVLKGIIPNQKPLQVIQYYIELTYQNKTYGLPDNKEVSLIYYGKISPMLKVLQFLLLYIGLFLSVRTGLEYFNDCSKSKKFAVLTGIVFLTLTLLINPLYLTYKFGYMNHSIPAITNLFPIGFLVITLLWIISIIILFRKKEWNLTSIVTGVLSILVYIFLM